MAFVNVSVYVPEAGMNINVDMVFPNDRRWKAEAGDIKGVITLLHGFYGCGEDWLRLTAAGRYAYDSGYLLICPGAGNSFYHNMAYGPPWYDIITEFLPRELNSIFKIPVEREINHIAGLSMGGYGAMRIGLSSPDRYATIGAFSGALDLAVLAAIAGKAPEARSFFTPVLGESLTLPGEADLLKLVAKEAERSRSLGQRVFVTCGKQDELSHRVYTQNQNFLKAAKNTPLDFTYREWDGLHEWQFWDRSLAEYIGFIEKSDYGAQRRGNWLSEEQGFTNT
ncbi:MAG: esterase family protein [Treponema sp.]|jgi:S-formylglutathione hydrolase FrmB|nr:esterase family protein [Treponema sp.]